MRLSGISLAVDDRRRVARMLHAIGNFERISDHALNLLRSARELATKKITLSASARAELATLEEAIVEILRLTEQAYAAADPERAARVEPLEQVVDLLSETIRLHHIDRLQTGACTIEKGFILADILNNYERIADHCSNIAMAVLEVDADRYQPHEYLAQVKMMDNPAFRRAFLAYRDRYLSRIV